jgi:hypothetical protein
MKGSITTAAPYDASHPDALAVYCSDGRFTHAVAGLLEKLGYDRLDTLTIPGGPGLFEMSTSSLTEVDTVRRAASFLVVGHHIKHVTLLAHEGCGYYKAQLSHEAPEVIERRQRQDLLASASWLRAVHHGVEVATFFARVVSGKVVFESVV